MRVCLLFNKAERAGNIGGKFKLLTFSIFLPDFVNSFKRHFFSIFAFSVALLVSASKYGKMFVCVKKKNHLPPPYGMCELRHQIHHCFQDLSIKPFSHTRIADRQKITTTLITLNEIESWKSGYNIFQSLLEFH